MTTKRQSFEGETSAFGEALASPSAASLGDDWISFGDAVTAAVEVAAIQRLRWIGAALASREEEKPASA